MLPFFCRRLTDNQCRRWRGAFSTRVNERMGRVARQLTRFIPRPRHRQPASGRGYFLSCGDAGPLGQYGQRHASLALEPPPFITTGIRPRYVRKPHGRAAPCAERVDDFVRVRRFLIRDELVTWRPRYVPQAGRWWSLSHRRLTHTTQPMMPDNFRLSRARSRPQFVRVKSPT